jgi:hypothetical protein
MTVSHKVLFSFSIAKLQTISILNSYTNSEQSQSSREEKNSYKRENKKTKWKFKQRMRRLSSWDNQEILDYQPKDQIKTIISILQWKAIKSITMTVLRYLPCVVSQVLSIVMGLKSQGTTRAILMSMKIALLLLPLDSSKDRLYPRPSQTSVAGCLTLHQFLILPNS